MFRHLVFYANVRIRRDFAIFVAQQRSFWRGSEIGLPRIVFPGLFTVAAHGENAGTIQEISNRRFSYQARDSPGDPFARDKWKSGWYDEFTGKLYLQSPRLTGVTRELTAIALTCSWASAFCVVEYKSHGAFYQFSRRPRRRITRWARKNVPRHVEVLMDSPRNDEHSSSSMFPPCDSFFRSEAASYPE